MDFHMSATFKAPPRIHADSVIKADCLWGPMRGTAACRGVKNGYWSAPAEQACVTRQHIWPQALCGKALFLNT